jgi:hypothetical protein
LNPTAAQCSKKSRFHSAAPKEFWGSFSRGGAPVVLMRRRMGEERFADFSRRVLARLEDALGNEPVEIRMTALLGIGTRAG